MVLKLLVSKNVVGSVPKNFEGSVPTFLIKQLMI
jgi:hypothetical protein